VAVIAELKKNGVTHVVWLPDSETGFLYRALTAENGLSLVPVCREGEAVPIAMGLWVGGAAPVVIIQNTGLLESGDSVRGLALDARLPLVMLVGYRGWTRHGVTADSAARLTEPTLHAWGLDYYLVESGADVGRISDAYQQAQRESRPVAVLVGAEYVGER
jgi:sulfopyruvate decarboxylase subunit alpha